MEVWQIADTIAFITKHKAIKIGLQFPDHLLKQCSSIALLLKEELKKLSTTDPYEIYIMADTTFAPCCVDEIAAQHVCADVIIHYGWSCCSPTKRTPVFHVLGHKSFDIQLLHELLFAPEIFKQTFASFKKIIILYEPHYTHYRNTFIKLLKHADIQFIITEIHSTSSLRSSKQKHENEKKNDDDEKQTHFCGFYYDPLLDTKEWNELLQSNDFNIDNIKQRYGVVYIGNDEFDEYQETPSSENQLYLSLLTNFGSCFKFISYNPDKVKRMNHDEMLVEDIFCIKKHEVLLKKMLMYRYSLIEKVKESNIIGIVCATLVVHNYLDIIKTLKKTIKRSGKKAYLFSIGKINQAKLGNFSEIDIFVVISCPMSFHYILPIHQQSFFKPLVTPFDVMLALNEGKSAKWTAMYSTDFNDVLNHSFKMGAIKSMQKSPQQNNDKTMATFGKAGGLVKNATDYMLHKRSWKGLQLVSDIPPSKIEQGLTGIASQYRSENCS